MTMLTEHRADELKRMDKDELIALLLKTEHVRDRLQRALSSLQDREPGRYAFYVRHLAMSYVRKANPELHQEAFSAACGQIDAQGGKSYQDVVAGLEAACEAAEQYIIAGHARRLWNEHQSYDTETARRAAEENPPPVVLQIRTVLDKAGVTGEGK